MKIIRFQRIGNRIMEIKTTKEIMWDNSDKISLDSENLILNICIDDKSKDNQRWIKIEDIKHLIKAKIDANEILKVSGMISLATMQARNYELNELLGVLK